MILNSQDLKTIWETYQLKLLNFIRSKTSDNSVAQDILQEVFLKLIKVQTENIEIRNIQSWLFQVTRNTISDHFRKDEKYRRDHFAVEETLPDKGMGTCICEMAGFVIQKYLPEQYARPLYMSDIENIPQKEIAEILGLSVSGAKSRVQRGRRMLKDLILKCVNISLNKNGEITDYQLKPGCTLPEDLEIELKRNKFSY